LKLIRIQQTIMRMKNGRAAGPGDIPIDLIKSDGQKLLEMITILLNKIINGETVPEEWKVALKHRYIRNEISGNVKTIEDCQ